MRELYDRNLRLNFTNSINFYQIDSSYGACEIENELLNDFPFVFSFEKRVNL